jgi:hypothetical protein
VASGGASPPDVVLMLTARPSQVAIARALAGLAYLGTVASLDLYDPSRPADASGVTVLVPVAPFEQATAANRALARDVQAFAPGTVLTPAVAAGYWSADLFARILAAVGRNLTVERFVAAARRLSYSVPGTVGPTEFPGAQRRPAPCGAAVQGDGSRFLVVAPYRCATPIPIR